MQITFIRHLPTQWNEKTWLQGRRDIGLSPITEIFQEGINHNQQLLKMLIPFDLVLASTLKRTHQTAHLYGYQAETEALLDELDFGPFEGRTKEKLHEEYGEKWIENPKELVLGESIMNLEERIKLFLDKYKEANNVLVFGHGSWIRAIVSYIQYGHINKMNQITVANNECITLPFEF
ncbi:putative phosphoglycerate mutase [Bacillus pakistanensis]|uniref:phosphoglycerate mutase (2,3-diphosphoglycerate-dependent) n=1 Tax=Rossellomorea pakistanensis TaxID=992288 RepID=A0ABS2NCJ7_9BACI|nr:histidine phosphatase family protein [Bacillus pakistanensis]MBM7585584.1 putative phosphoglycerate mutase [Bacillus pakistanensis]